MNQESFEEQQEALDPHRREERDSAALEIAGRLRQKGVLLTGRETGAQLDDLLTAVDHFAAEGIAPGGGQVVKTPASPAPEKPRFGVPHRAPRADAESYAG